VSQPTPAQVTPQTRNTALSGASATRAVPDVEATRAIITPTAKVDPEVEYAEARAELARQRGVEPAEVPIAEAIAYQFRRTREVLGVRLGERARPALPRRPVVEAPVTAGPAVVREREREHIARIRAQIEAICAAQGLPPPPPPPEVPYDPDDPDALREILELRDPE